MAQTMLMHVRSFQSCPTICDLMDCSLPGSSIHGILQTRILEWVAISSCRGSSQPRDQIHVSCIAGKFFTTEPVGKPRSWNSYCKIQAQIEEGGKTTRPFRYDLNQILYDCTGQVKNKFKGLDLVDRVPEELSTEVCNIV